MVVVYNAALRVFNEVRKKSVAKNFTSLTFSNVISQVFNLLAIIKLAKILSPSNYGLFAFLTVQSQILISIGDLGVTNILIRTIARNKEASKGLVYNGLLLRVSAIAIFSGIYFLYNFFLGSLTYYETLLVCIFPIVTCAANLFDSVFCGHQNMVYPSVVNVLFSSFWYLMIFLLPVDKTTVTNVFLVYIFVNFLKGVALYVGLANQGFIKGENPPFWYSAQKLLKESFPYFSLILLCLPFNYLSSNFLDLNSTSQQIAYYNLSQKLMSPISLVIGLALSALFPNLSSLWANDEGKFLKLIVKGVRFFIVLSLFICFAFTLFAKEVVMFLFPDEYMPAVAVCQLQIWYVFLMGVNSLIGTIWGSVNKERLLIKTTIVNVIISTPLLFYGSKFGAVGLAYAYIISFSIFEIYLWITFKKSIGIKIPYDKVLWFSALILFIVSYFIAASAGLILKVFILAIIIIVFSIVLRRKVLQFLDPSL